MVRNLTVITTFLLTLLSTIESKYTPISLTEMNKVVDHTTPWLPKEIVLKN